MRLKIKKRLLLVTAFYSPQIHVATNRMVAFAKYFKLAGYDVTVLTVSFDNASEWLEQNEEGVQVIRMNSEHFLNRSRFQKKSSGLVHQLKALKNKILNLLVIDDLPGFFKAFVQNKSRLNFKNYDYVLSSYAPLSAHLIAQKIKEEYPQIKWIADFRDEMSFHPRYLTSLKTKVQLVEKKFLNECDYVTSVSKPILDQFQSVAVSHKPQILEVRNGFDFPMIKEPEQQREVFKILYLGTFYADLSPKIFFQALVEFQNKIPSARFEVHIYSGAKNFEIPTEIISKINVHEKVSYEKVPALLKEASLLLLIQAVSERSGVYSGKTFDYLAVNRPILALVNEKDVASQLIQSCNAGIICHHHAGLDSSNVFEFIVKLYNDWKQNQNSVRDWDLIEQQSRQNQIAKLILKIQSKDIT